MWYEIQLGRPPGTVLYRIPYSFSAADVSRYHVDTSVPQFVADLRPGVFIEVSVKLVAIATIDRRGIMGDFFIAFAGIGRPQFVEAFEVVLVEDVSGGTDDIPLEIEVAFVRRK